jgi:hypothetical protein
MRTTISHATAPTLAFSPQERTERLAALGPERLREAMFFLSGFALAVCDAVLDATEPFDTDERESVADRAWQLAWRPVSR